MKTLKNVLLLNAVSSGATGLGLIFFPDFFAGLFEIKSTVPFVETGIFLAVFATLVFAVGIKNPINAGAVRFIIVLDTLWVVASFTVILFQMFNLSLIGYLMIAAVALWVAAMAYLQTAGVKQISVIK
ncbi:hypothetical protein LXM25_16825 [Dyadobacter sp. LJ53]|uniref:hypothetical protein n=1 Tax=Dyadobacter chenwenxiniae TaxID=2906456 RepID=UPI001F17EAF8|nr:hypothetical protein [Dyadobacter chenwenxiniae]MCF0051733.1 hypothetical protein [Dyadobacter chenwenxiniae]